MVHRSDSMGNGSRFMTDRRSTDSQHLYCKLWDCFSRLSLQTDCFSTFNREETSIFSFSRLSLGKNTQCNIIKIEYFILISLAYLGASTCAEVVQILFFCRSESLLINVAKLYIVIRRVKFVDKTIV